MNEEATAQAKKNIVNASLERYYRSIIQSIFIVAIIGIAVSFLYFDVFYFPVLQKIFYVLAIVTALGGYYKAESLWVKILSIVLPCLGFILYESIAVAIFQLNVPKNTLLFLVEQLLALLFFFASFLAYKILHNRTKN